MPTQHPIPTLVASRLLIRLVGPFHSVELQDVTGQVRLTEAESAARGFLHIWVKRQVEQVDAECSGRGALPVRRVCKPHVLGWTVEEGRLTFQVWSSHFDFGHFATTSTAARWAECCADYVRWCEAGKGPGVHEPLTPSHFALVCRHQQLATATLVVTSDRKMALVRGSPSLFLHPGYVHCLGGQVELGFSDVEESAMLVVQRESGVSLAEVSSLTCLGVSGNHPHDQPVCLMLLHTSLRERGMVHKASQATSPDGEVLFRPYSRREISRLLKEEKLTPPFRALLYLLLQLPKEDTRL